MIESLVLLLAGKSRHLYLAHYYQEKYGLLKKKVKRSQVSKVRAHCILRKKNFDLLLDKLGYYQNTTSLDPVKNQKQGINGKELQDRLSILTIKEVRQLFIGKSAMKCESKKGKISRRNSI